MDNKLKTIIKLLKDGNLHAEIALEKKTGLTCNEIKKLIKQLKKYGVEIERKADHGYRIVNGLELLNKKEITKYITQPTFKKILVAQKVDSTNTTLIDLIKTKKKFPNVCLAEFQTAGRGRLGKTWASPYGSNIYLSLLWRFTKEEQKLNGLSLVAAIAVVRTLKDYGITDNISVKWPNDVWWQKRKLAGVLIELFGTTQHVYNIIIGVGLNLMMPKKLISKIDQPWCDVQQITQNKPKKNKLAGLLINNLILALDTFQKKGLHPFLKEWQRLDITAGKKVCVLTPEGQKIIGISCGINQEGGLLLRNANNKIHSFIAGEVSLKM